MVMRVGGNDEIANHGWYALYGMMGLLVIAAVYWVSIRYEQGRRRAYEKMTPEERKEEDVFRRGVFRRR